MPEYFRFDAVQLLTQKNEVTNSANRFRRFSGFNSGLEHKIAGTEDTFQRVKNALVVQTLKNIIDRQERLGMLFRCRFQAGMKLFPRITWYRLKANGAGHGFILVTGLSGAVWRCLAIPAGSPASSSPLVSIFSRLP